MSLPLFNGTCAADRVIGIDVKDTINGRRGDGNQDYLYDNVGNETLIGENTADDDFGAFRGFAESDFIDVGSGCF